MTKSKELSFIECRKFKKFESKPDFSRLPSSPFNSSSVLATTLFHYINNLFNNLFRNYRGFLIANDEQRCVHSYKYYGFDYIIESDCAKVTPTEGGSCLHM